MKFPGNSCSFDNIPGQFHLLFGVRGFWSTPAEKVEESEPGKKSAANDGVSGGGTYVKKFWKRVFVHSHSNFSRRFQSALKSFGRSCEGGRIRVCGSIPRSFGISCRERFFILDRIPCCGGSDF